MTDETLDLIQATLLGDAADHAPMAIFVGDDDLRYIAVNRYACELLGYTRDELLALRATDLTTRPLAELQAGARELARSRRSAGSATVLRKDGVPIEIEYTAFTTTVAGMEVYVSFVWPLGSERAA